MNRPGSKHGMCRRGVKRTKLPPSRIPKIIKNLVKTSLSKRTINCLYLNVRTCLYYVQT